MRGSYRIIYTKNRPRPVVLLWPSGNLTFCLLETLGSNPDAAHHDPCPPHEHFRFHDSESSDTSEVESAD